MIDLSSSKSIYSLSNFNRYSFLDETIQLKMLKVHPP